MTSEPPSAPARDRHAWRARLETALAALLIGSIASRALFVMHEEWLPLFVADAQRVLDGTPYSVAFQNRLLGPLLLEGLHSWTGLEPTGAFVLATYVLMTLATGFAYLAIRRTGAPRATALTAAGLAVGLFVLLQDPRWMKIWDPLDLMFAGGLAWAAAAGASTTAFVVLFLTWLPSRESALYVPVWMALTSVSVRRSPLRASLERPRRLVVALLLTVVGMAVTVALREALIADRTAALHPPMTPWGNHFKVPRNLQMVADHVERLHPDVLVLLALGALCYAMWRKRARFTAMTTRLAALLGVIAASNVVFGAVVETRVWAPWAPLVVLVFFSLAPPADGRPNHWA
ncbi:MAG: hypothetical protein ACOC9O_01615 [Myxococcota bacterium]